MNILEQNQLNLKALTELSQKPELFAPGETLFWNDPHISKGMLETHKSKNCTFSRRRK